MEQLGVESDRSRSRAFRLLDELKKEKCQKKLKKKKKKGGKKLQVREYAPFFFFFNIKFIAEIQRKENEEKARRLQQEKNDPLVSEEMARMLQDGHYLKEFTCNGCQNKQTAGGVELRNCQDPICYTCFSNIVNTALSSKQSPQCPTCLSGINVEDITTHISKNKAQELSDMLTEKKIAEFGDLYYCNDTQCGGYLAIEQRTVDQFRCPKCNQNNCILCKSCVISISIARKYMQLYIFLPPNKKCDVEIHPPQLCPLKPQVRLPIIPPSLPMPIPIRPRHNGEPGGRPTLAVILNRKEWLNNEYFFDQWEDIEDSIVNKEGASENEELIDLEKLTNISKSYDVKRDSEEWKFVLNYVEDEATIKRQWVKVERIQQGKLWISYYRYCQALKSRGINPEERAFWHGTRATEPSKMWKGTGFDIQYARIGGCLWFAVSNTYSMNGFQYVCQDGSNCHQIFLGLVATGVGMDCKFIRQDTILNVYKNECTYPAYVITYRQPDSSSSLIGWGGSFPLFGRPVKYEQKNIKRKRKVKGY
ncbi:poly polymerase, catalytic region domain-containing protein [Reticulomyxa filosa]|uniref:Poly polymerase, catalytic region domain-containing protein n=1 Tax=Reticulomyxa filosa TaxID=46433 RepID=X6N268_RETFI|nr:poly polymerase, catalytic region domain-containing protein [Reticulomyxa filosa]|eukprot:ETO19998.1 poly polymerase, catalytic region domain-containing protein [Reticulomyxa filosa]